MILSCLNVPIYESNIPAKILTFRNVVASSPPVKFAVATVLNEIPSRNLYNATGNQKQTLTIKMHVKILNFYQQHNRKQAREREKNKKKGRMRGMSGFYLPFVQDTLMIEDDLHKIWNRKCYSDKIR